MVHPMKSHLQPHLAYLAICVAAGLHPQVVQGEPEPSNLLLQPGFEEPASIGAGLPTEAGLWSGDLATVVAAENGVSPRSGDGMLRFDATFASDPADQGIEAEVWQLVDLAEAGLEATGDTLEVEASAWVNRVGPEDETTQDRVFALKLAAHEGSPANFDPAATLASKSVQTASDADPETWERLRVRLHLPTSTTYVALAVVAVEDRSDDAEGEFAGHYVDDTSWTAHTVTTEPLEIGEVRRQNQQLEVGWTGGTAPYVIQRRGDVGTGQWEDFRVTEESMIQLPMDATTGFFRIASVGGEEGSSNFSLPLLQTLDLSSSDELRLLEELAVIHPETLQSRLTTLDLGGLQPVRLDNRLQTLPIQLPLFEDAQWKAIPDRILNFGGDRFSWFGRIEGAESSRVVVSMRGEQATGLIQNGTRLFQITRLEEDRYGVVEIDPGAFPEELPPDPPSIPAPLAAQAASTPAETPPGRRFINVMVVYTQDAADASADIELTIQNAIDVTNASYEDSNIPQRLHLVHTAKVDYDEGTGTSIETHRNRLQDPADGFMDEVHGWRDAYGADLVALMVEESLYCGITFIMEDVSPSFAPWGFSVTVRGCAVGNFSFAHELGHNMGARHDRFVDNNDGLPYFFNHGYVNVDGGWRTVMAYNSACKSSDTSCTRIGRWSNPSLDYLGSATGIETSSDNAADNRRTLLATDFVVSQFRTLGVNEVGDRFGAALAMGDFNGDGLADLAVGAPNEAPGGDPDSGILYVFAGTPFGLAPSQALSQEGGLGANEAGDLFSASLATGDFNGDGYDDLAVGGPGEAPRSDPKSGTVFLFRGGPEGLSHWHAVTQRELEANETDDAFGFSLAAGDFDDDGHDDLAVGAPGETVGGNADSGLVFLFQGSAGELVPWMVLGQDDPEIGEAGDRFGEALAVGDFNGDGRDDLAVGAPGESVGDGPASGAVFTFHGGTSGVVAGPFIHQANLGLNEAGDRFGQALAAGDFDRDGNDDLAVGAPGEAPGGDPEGGGFFVYRGGAAGLTPQAGFNQSGLGLNEAGDLFGSALATGDFDGDGMDDLAVGAPAEAPRRDPPSGYLFIYEGSSAGLTPWTTMGQRGLGDDEEGDEFASALATGDVDGDGLIDIAVGAPGESPGSDPQSGFVFTFKGRSSGNPLDPWMGLTEEQ